MTEQTRDTPRLSRRIKWVLWLSIGMNVIVIGVIAGAFLRGPFDGPPRHLREAAFPYTNALDGEARRQIGREIRSAVGGREARASLRAADRAKYAEALRLLRADPFDADRFADLLASQSARVLARQEVAQKALVAHLAAMNAQDRALYADRVEDNLTRWRKRRD